MATTFTWKIANLERNTADDGVTVAHWRCEGTDGTNTASAYGTTSHQPDPASPDFIAFADLTEADVLAWVYAQVDKDTTEAAVASQIEAIANPVSVSGTPWAAE